MKKAFLGLTLLTLSATLPAQADYYGQIGYGTSINGGSSTIDDVRSSYKTSPVYSIAGGYETPFVSTFLDTSLRAEAEYLRIRPKTKKDIKDSSFDGLMMNGYVMIPVPVIDPYVGAGIGMARFDHNNTLATQAITGIEYALPMVPITMAGEYRYLKTNEEGGKGADTSKFHSNIFMLKMRYNF